MNLIADTAPQLRAVDDYFAALADRHERLPLPAAGVDAAANDEHEALVA
jgi:hypothetical protein